ncbi:rod shape-determining protein MreC [Luminiphilus sp. nBUS_07]|uniref:rod shape-determining protein MreC n=1 Tax=Luminiphilus sp. nBUS_07 TaxID=3395314 RepID=UPI003EC0A96C
MGWRATLAIGCSLLLLFYLRDHPALETPRQFTTDSAALVYRIAAAPVSAFNSLGEFFKSYNTLRADNDRLSQENLVLKGQTQTLAAVLAENGRYRALLRSAETLEREVMVAEIIALTAAPSRHELIIDKGSADAVYMGQPLLGADGLMGQVIQVGQYSSHALLITDATHAVPVQVLRSGVRGLAEGTGTLNRLVVRHIAATTDIKEGDTLVTSGLGGLFPSGYPVAIVKTIVKQPGSSFSQVIAEPIAHLDRGRHVMLALDLTPSGSQ